LPRRDSAFWACPKSSHDIAASPSWNKKGSDQAEPVSLAASLELLVRWIASTFVLVLNWWVESDSPLPPREADNLFRGLIEPSLAEALS